MRAEDVDPFAPGTRVPIVTDWFRLLDHAFTSYQHFVEQVMGRPCLMNHPWQAAGFPGGISGGPVQQYNDLMDYSS